MLKKQGNYCEFVNVDSSQRGIVTGQLADEGGTGQIPDDGGAIARSRDQDLVTGRGRQARHGLRVSVEVLTDRQLLLAQLPYRHHLFIHSN